jgi:hypothetical protein
MLVDVFTDEPQLMRNTHIDEPRKLEIDAFPASFRSSIQEPWRHRHLGLDRYFTRAQQRRYATKDDVKIE